MHLAHLAQINGAKTYYKKVYRVHHAQVDVDTPIIWLRLPLDGKTNEHAGKTNNMMSTVICIPMRQTI